MRPQSPAQPHTPPDATPRKPRQSPSHPESCERSTSPRPPAPPPDGFLPPPSTDPAQPSTHRTPQKSRPSAAESLPPLNPARGPSAIASGSRSRNAAPSNRPAPSAVNQNKYPRSRKRQPPTQQRGPRPAIHTTQQAAFLDDKTFATQHQHIHTASQSTPPTSPQLMR